MVCAVVVAAGRSARMGGGDKNMIAFNGKPVIRRSLEAMENCDCIQGIVLVTGADRMEMYEGSAKEWGITKLLKVVPGGETRTASVFCGLTAVPQSCDIVAIHDGARPFVTPDIIRSTVESAREKGSGVAAIRCKDTVKAAGDGGLVQNTPDREKLWLVQTPQAFQYDLILGAYGRAIMSGNTPTDDAAVAEQAGFPVWLVEASPENIKITTPEDIRQGNAIVSGREGSTSMRMGEGYDVHRLVEGRPLVLGGVVIPHETGLLGHSDADVLTHAIMDALLGAAGLGDIGQHFPDNDGRYKDISSLHLLNQVGRLLKEQGYTVCNIDATVAAQRPKLAGYLPQMADTIAQILNVSADLVNIKATTTEGLGFEGRHEGISARAVCLLEKITSEKG